MPPTRIGCRRLRLLVPVLGCVIVVRLGTTWPARPTSGALALVALRFDAILGAMTTIGTAGTEALLANIWLRGRTPTADYVIYNCAVCLLWHRPLAVKKGGCQVTL